MNLAKVMRELAALGNEKMREANARAGDAHRVNLTQLRALAKQLKTDHALAGELWRTGDPDARLLATLVFKPKALSADELDAMVRADDPTHVRPDLTHVGSRLPTLGPATATSATTFGAGLWGPTARGSHRLKLREPGGSAHGGAQGARSRPGRFVQDDAAKRAG